MALKDFCGTWDVRVATATVPPVPAPGGSVRIEHTQPSGTEVSIAFDSGQGQTTVTGDYQQDTDSIQVLSQQPDPQEEIYISRYANEDHSYRAIYGLTIRSDPDPAVAVWGARSQEPPPAILPTEPAAAPSPFDGTYRVKTTTETDFPVGTRLDISMNGTRITVNPCDTGAESLAHPLTFDPLTDSVRGDLGDPTMLRVWSLATTPEGKRHIYGLSIPLAAIGGIELPEQGGACGAEDEGPPPDTDR